MLTASHSHTLISPHTQILDAGHFWAQFSDGPTLDILRYLMDSINGSRPLNLLIVPPKKMPGQYCLAKYAEDDRYYRAKIVSVVGEMAQVSQFLFVLSFFYSTYKHCIEDCIMIVIYSSEDSYTKRRYIEKLLRCYG